MLIEDARLEPHFKESLTLSLNDIFSCVLTGRRPKECFSTVASMWMTRVTIAVVEKSFTFSVSTALHARDGWK
jgi:hypothetical protein